MPHPRLPPDDGVPCLSMCIECPGAPWAPKLFSALPSPRCGQGRSRDSLSPAFLISSDLYYSSPGVWSPDRWTPFLLLGHPVGPPHPLPPGVSNLFSCPVAPTVLPHVLVQDLLTVLRLFTTRERIPPSCQLFLLWIGDKAKPHASLRGPQLALAFPDLGVGGCLGGAAAGPAGFHRPW